MGRLYQIESASTESAAGHSPAVITRKTFGGFYHDVKFRATDFVEVAKTAVRFPHQLSETVQIGGAEAASRVMHPFIFLHHVTASLVDCSGNIFRVLDELID